MSNSTEKLAIVHTRKDDGSPWIEVVLLGWPGCPWFRPSLEDLHRIVQAIAACEDEKYPPPQFAGRARFLSFLKRAIYEADYGKLAREFKIPEYDGVKLVRTNGAKIAIRDDDER